MSNVVLAYPTIRPADFDWIQGIRKIHDRLYEVVKPHFTFVFPTTKLSEADLIHHAKLMTKTATAIKITLSKAIVVEDDSKAFFHTFLVPSDGNKEIIALHDLLYTDDLLSELREDIPFIPHMGIATNESRSVMQEMANALNGEGISITGSIDALTVARYDNNQVHDIVDIQLHQA